MAFHPAIFLCLKDNLGSWKFFVLAWLFAYTCLFFWFSLIIVIYFLWNKIVTSLKVQLKKILSLSQIWVHLGYGWSSALLWTRTSPVLVGRNACVVLWLIKSTKCRKSPWTWVQLCHEFFLPLWWVCCCCHLSYLWSGVIPLLNLIGKLLWDT